MLTIDDVVIVVDPACWWRLKPISILPCCGGVEGEAVEYAVVYFAAAIAFPGGHLGTVRPDADRLQSRKTHLRG